MMEARVSRPVIVEFVPMSPTVPSSRSPAETFLLVELACERPAQARAMGRRARLFAVLAGLSARQQRDLARAVREACRWFVGRHGPARVRFELGNTVSPCHIQVRVVGRGEPAGSREDSSRADLPDGEKVRQAGRLLWRCEFQELPGPTACLRLAQATGSDWRIPPENERRHWGELLAASSPEKAVRLAQQRGQQAVEALGAARGAAPAMPEVGADRTDLETLSLVAAHATNAVLILDAHGAIQWVNRSFTTLSGYALADVGGRPANEVLFGPSTSPKAIREFHRALREGHEVTQDLLQYHRDGRTVWVECRLIPIRDPQGQLIRWIGIETDITRRWQTEQALRAAKQAAEESNRAKSEFLANMSHEIRTPLNAILGMTELALATELSKEQGEYLRTVKSSADALLQLLNDVLDLSKIEAGRLTLEQIDVDLTEIVQQTVQALAVRAHEKGLELIVRLPWDLPPSFRGDPTRIRQILFNLVGNAIKFTERGEVVVTVELQWSRREQACLHFAIRDTGIGIPREQVERIFESFAQVDSSVARRFGGSGLGLAITSQLLERMDGRLWVESEPGVGSTFHFTICLPFGDPTAAARQLPDPPLPLRDRRVLIVDDNATQRAVLEEWLHQWGAETIAADTMATALERCETAIGKGQAFEIVLVDADLIGADGFPLVDRLQRSGCLKPGRVVILSPADRPLSAERCHQFGIAAHVGKPVSPRALAETLQSVLDDSSPPPLAPVTAVPAADDGLEPAGEATRKLDILVADDHDANRSLAMKILERRGHRCTPASSGDQAIAACAQRNFDVVLMDVQMPGRDGLSATRWIRRRERRTGRHVPIIALTAHALAGDREKCLAAGMDAYLAKPLHARDLTGLVERITGGVREGERRPAPSGPLRIAGFDFNAALERMDGERDLLRDHMNYTLNDAPQLLQRMRQALDQADGHLLEISAHRLKSLVSSYNHHEARELAQHLEKCGHQACFDRAAPDLERLATLIDEFASAVRHYLNQQPPPGHSNALDSS